MKIQAFPRLVAVLALSLAACGGPAEEPSAPQPVPATDPAPAETTRPGITISLDELQRAADSIALVPSPIETQRAVESAGIETQLASLIEDREYNMGETSMETTAVRTGVVLADALLTVRTAEKDKQVGNLVNIRTGMSQLGGGDDIDATITDLQDRVQTESITTDQLLAEFETIAGATIPELEFNGKPRVVPLIQAGAWLEGANLVSKALKAKGDPSAADQLLKQPKVVEYFTRYVREEGGNIAPIGVASTLDSSLGQLKVIAEKSGPLSMEDIEKIIEITDDVLALL